MKSKGSARENQSSAEGIYGDANSDTRYDKDAFNRRWSVAQIKHAPKDKTDGLTMP